RVLRDHGDTRLEQVGQQDVVEADQRDAVVQAAAAKRAERANRDQVLAGEERGGGRAEAEDLLDRCLRSLDAAHVQANQLVVDLDAAGAELFDIAAVT